VVGGQACHSTSPGFCLRSLDLLTAVCVIAIWSLGFTLTKASLSEFPPMLLMVLRFTLTALVLIWWAPPPWRYMRKIFLISLIGAGIQYSITFTGLKGLDASTAIILVQLEVPFAALLAAVFLNDMIGWRRAIGVALAFVGVLVLAGEPTVREALVSAIMMAGGAMLFAAGQVMTKSLNGAVAGFRLTAWIAIFAVPQLVIASLIFEENQIDYVRNASLLVWGTIVYLGVAMTAIAYSLWYRLIGLYSINLVMPFTLLLPFMTTVFAVLILGEPLRPVVIAGGLITVAGVAIIVIRKNPFVKSGSSGAV